MYVWCTPSHHNGAFTRLRSTYPVTSSIPLISSNNVRLFLQGIFSGVTSINDIYPGDPLTLDLFVDNAVHVNHVDVQSKNGRYEEKITSWISSDKKKFLTRTNEYILTVRSSHPQPILTVMVESIPISSSSDIQIEIISPQKTIISDWNDDERFIGETVDKVLKSLKTNDANDDIIMYSSVTGTIFFMKFLNPNEEYKVTLKYRFTWPDGKKIDIY